MSVLEDFAGFAWWVWARRADRSENSHGVLLLSDEDIMSGRAHRHAGRLRVVREERDGVRAVTSLTAFAPGANKAHAYMRTGVHDWTPAPLVLEKLTTAYERGVDVLAVPVQRMSCSLRVSKQQRSRGALEGEPEFHDEPTDWAAVAAFLAPLPLPSPLAGLVAPPVPTPTEPDA